MSYSIQTKVYKTKKNYTNENKFLPANSQYK